MRVLFIALLFVVSLIFACKKTEPDGQSNNLPVRTDTTRKDTVAVADPPIKPPVDTSYKTSYSPSINTFDADAYYNLSIGKVTATQSSNANGGGIKTKTGDSVSVEIFGLSKATITNLGDALDISFPIGSKPYFQYTSTNTVARTKTITPVYFGTSTSSASHFIFQGSTPEAFKNNGVVYDTAFVKNALARSPQSIVILSVK